MLPTKTARTDIPKSKYATPTKPNVVVAERNFSIDVLRTLSMMLVVLLHVSATYASSGMKSQVYNTSFWTGNFVDSFCRVCVPLFVLISGSFLLGREESYAVFYKKRASKILWPLVSWIIIYSFYEILMGYLLQGRWEVLRIIKSLFIGGPFYHLWYMYMLIGLYLVTPIINKAIKGLKLEQVSKTSFILLIAGFIIDLSNFYYENSLVFFIWFVEYLGYFLMGHVLIRSRQKASVVGLLALYVLSSALIAALTYYFKNFYFYHYTSPLVVVASLAIYKIFSQAKLEYNILAKVSSFTLGVYLIHAGVLDIFVTFEKKTGLTTGVILIDVLVKFFAVLVVSLIIAKFISRIPILKKII